MRERVPKHTKKPLHDKEKLSEAIAATREMLLANLSMLAQVPAQTFHEKDRAEFILGRFTEGGITDPTTDSMHNAIGRYNGRSGRKTILINTHMDNQFDSTTDQNVTITENKAFGAGIADDNLPLALLMTLPDIICRANLELENNLVFLASTRYHGRGDFGGMRQFIAQNAGGIDAAINLSGTSIGSLNYFTLSRVRCDIKCEMETDHESLWQSIAAGNAILVINEVIESLFSIPLPRRPRTVLNIGMISGGERYSRPGREASVNLEALSEDDETMTSLIDEISTRCTDIAARYGADVSVDFFGRHKAASMTSRHPLIKAAISVIKELGYHPIMEYSNSEISVSMTAGIPSLGLALTTGKGGKHHKSYIDLPPINKGILQLLMILKAIDSEENDKND
ncbi:MAG: M20/M25/M40 family metallo-hydrolase [Victivallales bacterium]|nr:M20/M25/M40 family metallo-hydrolase [Victivallales bacterium]